MDIKRYDGETGNRIYFMRILFVSGVLIGSGLCQKLVSEKNDVKLYIHEEAWKTSLDGIVPKTNDWRAELEWVGMNGLIVFDDVSFGKEQDELRRKGYTVIGGSEGGDKLELDRRHFQEISDQFGIETLPSYDFATADEAIAFVKSNRDRWVVKQSTHLSYLNFIGKSETGSDVLRVLEQYKARGIRPVHLQKFADGIEVGVARYFNGNDWVGPIEINHEHKMLHDGDIGPLTPEMGTILWYTDMEVRLFKEILNPLTPYLRKIDFRGDIDVNCIVTKDHAYPLEATPRFGNPSTEIQVILHNSPWSEFLYAIASGVQYALDYKKGYGIAVALVVPPFPYEPDQDSTNQQSPLKVEIDTSGPSPVDMSHIHFEECSKIGDEYYWTGKYGAMLYATAHAETISEARESAYNRIQGIRVPKMHYRKDIGLRVEDHDILKLQEWKWI